MLPVLGEPGGFQHIAHATVCISTSLTEQNSPIPSGRRSPPTCRYPLRRPVSPQGTGLHQFSPQSKPILSVKRHKSCRLTWALCKKDHSRCRHEKANMRQLARSAHRAYVTVLPCSSHLCWRAPSLKGITWNEVLKHLPKITNTWQARALQRLGSGLLLDLLLNWTSLVLGNLIQKASHWI